MLRQRLQPERLGGAYILAMMLSTRLVASLGGSLSVYYVTLMLTFSPDVERHFFLLAAWYVSWGIVFSALLGLYYTPNTRRALNLLREGRRLDPDLAAKVGPEIVLFPGRQCRREMLIDPPLIVLPICAGMRVLDGVSLPALVQTGIAGCLGIAAVLLISFFMEERWLGPLVRYFVERGVPVDFDAMPASRLHVRLNVCVSSAVVLTAVMIGGLANQRAEDIINNPSDQAGAVANLRQHTVIISLAAAIIGLVLSRLLAASIASRVRLMVDAMRRVQRGSLSERLPTTTTDEIDSLARQFNAMVERLETNDHTIRDLNANLEAKVRTRTRQLTKNRRSLKRSLIKLRGLHQDLDGRNRELETAYRDLAAMQGQLVHSEKMSSLGQLVAGLAHEINNSINAVYNGIQPLTQSTHRLQGALAPLLAGEPFDCSTEKREEIDKLFRRLFSLATVIENGATRTARIIADLKTFSHPGKEHFDDFDLHESLDMCLNLLFSQVKHRIVLARDYGEIGTVHGPHGHLNQVFMNILTNAQQAIEGEGHILVTTRLEGEIVRVSIRDDGPGIPDEIKGRIFDPFFTTKEPGLGTGLGLSISYGIIHRLGGTIECHSSPGEGTEFIVSFPRQASMHDADTKTDRRPVGIVLPTIGAGYETGHLVC